MKTWSLAPILTSAYLSAMLTSGLAPIRPSVIFAAAVDPMIAQKALQNAVSAMSASGWAVPMGIFSALPDAPQASISTQTPKADPVMTDELMARLIKLANGMDEPAMADKVICAVFKLCDGTADLPVRQLQTENPEGHYLMIPWAPGSKDMLIVSRNSEGTFDCYLTDKNYKLRAAAIATATSARLIPVEKAAAKFKAELSLFAKEASDLPPTGTAVAGNS